MDDEVERAKSAKRGSPYLNAAQAAHYLGVSIRHLERLRAKRTGPAFRRHAHAVQYHIDDLRAWSRSTTKDPKS